MREMPAPERSAMNDLEAATLTTLAEVTKTFEDAAEHAEPDDWADLLMLAAPYKAALVAAFGKGREQAVKYLRVAQANMQGGGLSSMIGATEKFADMLESFDGTDAALGNLRMYGMVLHGAALQTVAEMKGV
jgi:hypothetical protein